MEHFIQKIEQLRLDKGYTNLQVSLAMGYKTESAYRLKITGKNNITINDLISLIQLYHLDTNDISYLFSTICYK